MEASEFLDGIKREDGEPIYLRGAAAALARDILAEKRDAIEEFYIGVSALPRTPDSFKGGFLLALEDVSSQAVGMLEQDDPVDLLIASLRGNDTRTRILTQILERGAQKSNEIAAAFKEEKAANTVSGILSRLQDGALLQSVRSTIDGRERLYQLTDLGQRVAEGLVQAPAAADVPPVPSEAGKIVYFKDYSGMFRRQNAPTDENDDAENLIAERHGKGTEGGSRAS